MKACFVLFAFCLAAAIAGCNGSPYAAVERMVPHEANAAARNFLGALQAGDLERAESFIAPSQRNSQEHAALTSLAALVGSRTPDTLRAINLEGYFGPQTKQLIITYELTYADYWLLARIAVIDSGGVAQITDVRANGVPHSAAALNALTLAGKSPVHYLLALLAVALPMFMLVTIVQVVRSNLPWRWLWAVVSVVGFGRLAFDWTNGMMEFSALQVQILGVGITRSGGPYLPWILSISVPVGAVLAQLRLRQRRQAAAAVLLTAREEP